MENKELNWNIHDTNFYGQYWKVENAKANIALVHGMGEHCNRYADFVIPKLNEAGFSVIAFDHFGHGKTEGKLGHCPSYEAVLDSVDKLIEKSNEHLGSDLPLFLYGHSMGGNVVANYAINRQNNLKGYILTSPMLKIAFDPPAWKMFAGKIMRNIYPAFQESTGLDASAISRDKQAVQKYVNDPLVHDKVTINFSLPFFEAGEYSIENAVKIKAPTLVLHGTADTITSCPASEKFAQNAGDNCTFKKFEGCYHELHNEPENEVVLSTITDWVKNNI